MGVAADEGPAECTKRVEALAQAWHTTSKGLDYSMKVMYAYLCCVFFHDNRAYESKTFRCIKMWNFPRQSRLNLVLTSQFF